MRDPITDPRPGDVFRTKVGARWEIFDAFIAIARGR